MLNKLNMARMVQALSSGIIAFVSRFGGGVSKKDTLDGAGMEFGGCIWSQPWKT